MSRAFEPHNAGATTSRPLPRRRVPPVCSASGEAHRWLVGWDAITRQLTGFEQRHNPAVGRWEWVACLYCGIAHQRQREAYRRCGCGKPIFTGSKAVCGVCAKANKLRRDRIYHALQYSRVVAARAVIVNWCVDCNNALTATKRHKRCEACQVEYRRGRHKRCWARRKDRRNAIRHKAREAAA